MAVYYKGTHARAPGQARKSWGYRTTEVHGLQLVVCVNVIRCSPEPAAFSCWMPINWGLGSLTFSGSTFLYDFQTLVSSEDLSLSNILYLKLIKVELLWIKVGVSLGPPTQPLLSLHQALCYLHRTPVTLWNTLWKPLLCPELWLSCSLLFPKT